METTQRNAELAVIRTASNWDNTLNNLQESWERAGSEYPVSGDTLRRLKAITGQ